MFDYIIIDAPPLGIFTDANVLINRADAALLVVRAGRRVTRWSTVCSSNCRANECWAWCLNRAEARPDGNDLLLSARGISAAHGTVDEEAEAELATGDDPYRGRGDLHRADDSECS